MRSLVRGFAPLIMNGPVTKFPKVNSRSGIPSGYRMRKVADRGEIYLYGVIGVDWFGDGVSAKRFADDLKGLGDVKTIDLRINSEGGDVFAGKAMHTLLTEHKAKVVSHIDGLAASAASYVAMAGEEIEISEGAFMMIHNAWTWAVGDSNEMRRQADLLDTINGTIRDIYVARTGNKADDVEKWMDEETWMTGKEALQKGFADKVVDNLKVAASIAHPDKFKNLPAALRPNRSAIATAVAAMRR